MSKYRKGQNVSWKWGQGEAGGKVAEVHKEPVEKTLNGSKIKRNADEDNPAYLIEQDDGSKVLKSESELS